MEKVKVIDVGRLGVIVFSLAFGMIFLRLAIFGAFEINPHGYIEAFILTIWAFLTLLTAWEYWYGKRVSDYLRERKVLDINPHHLLFLSFIISWGMILLAKYTGLGVFLFAHPWLFLIPVALFLWFVIEIPFHPNWTFIKKKKK